MSETIEIRCPSCGKIAVCPLPPSDDFACQRCRCQLATLATIRAAAAAHLNCARAALLSHDFANALHSASASWDLRHSRAAATTAFIASTLGGDALQGCTWLVASRQEELAD